MITARGAASVDFIDKASVSRDWAGLLVLVHFERLVAAGPRASLHAKAAARQSDLRVDAAAPK
jgi:hypothetical protein